MNLFTIFITGVSIGGLSCLAVQGGLLASVITSIENKSSEKSRNHVLFATSAFLISKLIAYTILGFILGSFGGAINISGNVQTYMQLLAGIYMVLVGLNLLDIHPIFRYVIIQPPRFLTKIVKNQSRSKAIFAPAILGAMTIFIPCGTTVAMEALAISSANSINGALIMAAFILGTIPMFLGIGFLTTALGGFLKTGFYKLAGVLVIFLGLISLNGALIALGSPVFLPISANKINGTTTDNNNQKEVAENSNNKQEIEIFVTSRGYSPNYITVKKGIPVNLKLTSKDAYSCASAFRIPSLGISKNLGPNESEVFTFTPTESGKIPFSCSMGMYRGVIEVQ